MRDSWVRGIETKSLSWAVRCGLCQGGHAVCQGVDVTVEHLVRWLEQQIPSLRCAPVGMTILFKGMRIASFAGCDF